MLHRILHHPFSLSSSPLSPHLLSCSSPRRLQGMEFVEGGFGPKTPGKAVVLNMDDGGGGAAAAGDDFFVDELLDFSNGYSETEEQPVELPENEMDGRKICPFLPVKQEAAAPPPPPPENGALSPELSVQAAEGLESLEWLSHFVEESFSDYPLTGKFPHNPTAARSEPPQAAAAKEQPCFTTPVQTKARTKRARTGVRVWPVLSPSSFAETSAASSSSSSSSTSFSPPALYFIQTETGDSSLRKPPAKKRKSKPADVSGGGGAGQQQPRRCSHCGVTKTPQWRAGPLGPKTLCNACGVRFKSGRLLPEYRPACSPTFSTDLHSNSHRKVLEMRRKKELEN